MELQPAVTPPPSAPWRSRFAWSEDRGGPGLTSRYFRRCFSAPRVAGQLRIHVTADARYRLWLNGERLGFGPAKGSLQRYYYETYDLGPKLREGINVLAAEVRWFGENSPLSEVHSPIPGFLVETVETDLLETPGAWRVWCSHAVTPDTTAYIGNANEFLNHCEITDVRREPIGWKSVDFDDSSWALAVSTGPAGSELDKWGVAPLRRLTPRDIPLMVEEPRRFTRTIQSRQLVGHAFAERPIGWRVAAGAGGKLLLDAGHLVTGFPRLRFRGGRGREVRVLYAEALGDWDSAAAGGAWRKGGVRDAFTRSDPHGYRDTVRLAGETYAWEPFHWRAFRWLELEVLPGDQPVTIEDADYVLCVHPQTFRARVETSDPDSGEVMEVSARTLRMSAHENYDDSPYFEQFSYAADARLQALGSLHLCNDPSLPRKTLRLFLDTLRADGLVDARVPCQYARQTIPYFCLHWILMVEDYWTWVGRADVALVRECLVAVDSILAWFRACLRVDGFVGPTGGWNMVDNSLHWPGGEPAAVSAGGSTYLTSLYISALQAAQRLHRLAGVPEDAARWEQLAARLVPLVRAAAWDEAAGLFVEGMDHRTAPFSQHAQAAAINAGVATPEQIRRIVGQLWAHPGLIRTNSMQSFYLAEALTRAGRYEQVHDHVLLPWRQALRDGLTTWPEYPDPCRSDCHGWAAWPAVEYVRSVLGVRAAAPGWAGVLLAPQTGGLDWASGRVPTPVGEIWVHWQRAGDGIALHATVPAGVPVEVRLGSLVELYPAGGTIELTSRQVEAVPAPS